MKLEPVYLLAPEPKKTVSGVSRRAVLLSGALGMAIGFGISRAVDSPPPVRSAEEAAILEWALEVQSGDDRRLADECMSFLSIAASHRDPRLQVGITRLAHLATDHNSEPLMPSRRVAVARWIEVLVAEWPELTLTAELTAALGEVR